MAFFLDNGRLRDPVLHDLYAGIISHSHTHYDIPLLAVDRERRGSDGHRRIRIHGCGAVDAMLCVIPSGPTAPEIVVGKRCL